MSLRAVAIPAGEPVTEDVEVFGGDVSDGIDREGRDELTGAPASARDMHRKWGQALRQLVN